MANRTYAESMAIKLIYLLLGVVNMLGIFALWILYSLVHTRITLVEVNLPFLHILEYSWQRHS